jgi:hypothetical protein
VFCVLCLDVCTKSSSEWDLQQNLSATRLVRSHAAKLALKGRTAPENEFVVKCLFGVQIIPRSERASENNHGNYYDVQLIACLKYLKRCEALTAALCRSIWCLRSVAIALSYTRQTLSARNATSPEVIAIASLGGWCL